MREGAVSKTFVETSTELLEGLDEMVREGYYASRTEGVNDAITQLLRQYKVSKLHAKDSVAMGTQQHAETSPAAPAAAARGAPAASPAAPAAAARGKSGV
jgi:Arc/MetJ-type ribon-helix-helix transcriptional regulator